MNKKFRSNEDLKKIDSFDSIFFATFSHYDKGIRLPTNGFVEPILSFFLPRTRRLVLLDQPHPVSDCIDPIVEIYHNNKLMSLSSMSRWLYYPVYLFCSIPSRQQTRISYKIRDFISVFVVSLRIGKTYDLFIGLESINALAGILLRLIGRVKTVVYYVSDYSPERYGRTLFNAVYIWLDHFCVKHANFTWDVSPTMKDGRVLSGLPLLKQQKVITVQNGLFPSQIRPLSVNKRMRDSVVYMGILDPDMGIDILVEAMAFVVRRRPDATLHIIGGSHIAIERVKGLTRRYNIEKNVVFYGFLPPNKEMSDIVRRCWIGVAPYRTYKASRRKYGDPGKIRQYVGCGLPVVTTNYVWYAKEVAKRGAGIVTNDNPRDLSVSILTLMRDRAFYRRAAKKALAMGKVNSWEKSYSSALRFMFP